MQNQEPGPWMKTDKILGTFGKSEYFVDLHSSHRVKGTNFIHARWVGCLITGITVQSQYSCALSIATSES